MPEIERDDMYGNPIVPLGETGYGVSVCFMSIRGTEPFRPCFTIFHVSDGFAQALFSVEINDPDRPNFANVFYDRIAELMASNPHGLPTDWGVNA